MNYVRILRATSGLLIFIGYQIHHFNTKTRRYRISPWAISYSIVLTILYLIAFTHHFEQSALLHFLKDASPFLRRLIRLQVLLGIKVYVFGFYEQCGIVRAANKLVTILPNTFARKFSLKEAYTYFLNFSTHFISLLIVLYVAYEMDFELPPLDNILVFSGLFVPHLTLSGSLRLYNIGKWFQRERLLELQADLQHVLPMDEEENTCESLVMLESGNKSINTPATLVLSNSETNVPASTKQELNVSLQLLLKQLEQLTETARILKSALKRQLLLLIILNSHALLAGTYSRVYYESTWKVVFPTRTKHVFQATNCGIFILIFWDYLTLCLTWLLFENVRQKFTDQVQKTMKQRQHLPISTRCILSNIHELLKNGFRYKLLHAVPFNIATFLLIKCFVGLVIALFVIYYYLDDQILALSERLDGLNSDDD